MKKISISTHYTTGAIEDISIVDDPTNFRWTRKYFGLPNGLNYLSEKKEEENIITLTYEYFNGLILTVNREVSEFYVKESYTLKNSTQKPVDIDENYSVGITFADDSDIAEVALKRRAYSRIFFGGNSFAVYNSKFNGDGDGLGVVLTKGTLGKVKESRIPEKSLCVYDVEFSNCTLNPDEEYSFEWLLFAYESVEEFVDTVRKYQPFPILSKYPILKGETFGINTEDELFIDGVKWDNQPLTLDKELHIKAQRGEKYYEFILKPLCENDYAKKLFLKSFYQKEKQIEALEKAKRNPDNAKEILFNYFKKKNKKYFDINMPLDIIESDDELKGLFIKKAEYALLKDKSYYYPYQIIAKYDYLKKVYSINHDPRYLDKLDELEKLRNAIYRLWIW